MFVGLGNFVEKFVFSGLGKFCREVCVCRLGNVL